MKILLKAISWEFVSNLICFYLAFLMFGNFYSCLIFTIICIVVKILLFCLHELLWKKDISTRQVYDYLTDCFWEVASRPHNTCFLELRFNVRFLEFLSEVSRCMGKKING
jgi:uncharacterized membrane protein